MKKFLTFLIVIFLLFPSAAEAVLLFPYLNLKVSVITNGGDGVFDFHVNGSYPDSFSKDFSIQTASGLGTYFLGTTSSSSETFSLVQNGIPGWQIANIVCFSSNPQITFSSINNGVLISAYPYSTIDCTFTETKVDSKKPVLIIPGTLGTEIWKETEKLWPDVDRMTSIIHPSDDFMDPLAFKNDATPLDTSLSLGEVVGKPHPEFDYSDSLVEDLTHLGYTKNLNLILFPYDWRDDIKKNANSFLKFKIDELVGQSASGKIDIVAHSQGGLLVKRLLLDHPEYTSKIDKLIFAGTPNLGAPKAAKVLLYGDSFGIEKWRIGLDPLEMKKIAQNMPAIYQMLPSKAYFDHSDGYLSELDHGMRRNYSAYDQTTAALAKAQYGLNTTLLNSSNDFHVPTLDNMDFTSTGIKAFNIMGCESPTIGRILANSGGSKLDLDYVPGDGTVPIISANNVLGASNFFVLRSEDLHGTMLTTEGVRQKIVNILNDKQSSVAGIASNPALCVFEGNKVSVHSPVNMDIYDEFGRHAGLKADGSPDIEIEGVQYDILGHEKFAFLPLGHTYTLKLAATDKGTFDFYSEKVKEYSTISTAYYHSVPVTSTSTAEIILNDQNNQTINFTSDSRVILPSSILDANESQDMIPPTSTSTLTGTMGQPGFYRSSVSVALAATDPVVNNNSSQTSGVLALQYSLDNLPYQQYSSTTPLTITAEGSHTISFYATDRAGNNEDPQTVSFTIDTTPPELIMQFNPSLQDLQFTATDTLPAIVTAGTGTSLAGSLQLPPSVKVADQDSVITATDAAGNTIELALQAKDRKQRLKADIKSLSYNSIPADISKTQLHFDWFFDKKNTLQALVQQVKSKKDFNIVSLYAFGKTMIVGKDQTGKISTTLPGLQLLKVSTQKGDFNWSY